MAYFSIAYPVIRSQEGGYKNDPAHDSGDPTNYGITTPLARAYGYSGDMHQIPLDLVQHIYQAEFWDRWNLSDLDSQGAATAIFSAEVNFGRGGAGPIVQQALADLGWDGDQDGAFGPQTLQGVNDQDPNAFCQAFSAAAAAKYQALADANPTKYGSSLDGWLNRAASFASMAADEVFGSVADNPGTSAMMGLLFVCAVVILMQRGRA